MSPALARKPVRNNARKASVWAIWAVVLSAIAGVGAFYHSFSQHKPFDDEGMLMEWIRSFMRGDAPYVSVHIFYGPAYFFYQSLAHGVLRTLPTANSIRIVSIVFWLASVFLVFAVVRRVTQSWALALAAFLLAFRAAQFLGEEPGHPQELCLFLIVSAAFLMTANWRKPVCLALLGALAAALFCTKINAGLLVILALGVAWVFCSRPSPLLTVWQAGAAVALLCFAPVLLWPNLMMSWAQRFLVLEQCSLLAALVAIWPVRRSGSLTAREVVPAIAGFVTVAAAMFLYAVAHGSSPSAMVQWMIVKPRSMGGFWYLPLSVTNLQVGWAVFGVLLSFFARSRFFTPGRLAAAQVGLGLGVALLAAGDRYAALLCFAAPFTWLLAVPPQEEGRQLVLFPRSALALMGPLIVLYAYPVAGVHVRFVDIVLMAISALILGEGWTYWRTAGRFPAVPWLRRGLEPAAICLMMGLLVLIAVKARSRYLTLEPVNLPGAAGLRLPAQEARAFYAIAADARNSCSALFEVPAMPSFNLWTQLPGPVGLPFANVVTGLPDEEQQTLIQSIAANPRSCIIYNPEMVTFWTRHASVSSRPIIRSLQRDFHAVAESNGNRLMVRNSR